jgi:hypothetical protein
MSYDVLRVEVVDLKHRVAKFEKVIKEMSLLCSAMDQHIDELDLLIKRHEAELSEMHR